VNGASEAKLNFCGGIGFDNPDWPGPWGCGTVMQEAVDGIVTTHLCALSCDHTHYRDEPHVCTSGHEWPVWTPPRRWWEWLLRRPLKELPRRRGPFGSFWDDLNWHMENPKFRRAYEEHARRIQEAGNQGATGVGS